MKLLQKYSKYLILSLLVLHSFSITQLNLTFLLIGAYQTKKLLYWYMNLFADLVAGDANATTIAWRLLEYLLNKYEVDNQSTLHKAVAAKLISLCVFLPQWLEASYKVLITLNFMLYLSSKKLFVSPLFSLSRKRRTVRRVLLSPPPPPSYEGMEAVAHSPCPCGILDRVNCLWYFERNSQIKMYATFKILRTILKCSFK